MKLLFILAIFSLIGLTYAKECSDEEFLCDLSQICIPDERVCDGWNDCQGGTDERGCTSPPTTPSTTPPCRGDEWRCKDGHCISFWWKCDGIADCEDGDDEEDCSYTTTQCPGFLCKVDKKCINADWVCDGDWDCKDGEDEENCDLGLSR